MVQEASLLSGGDVVLRLEGVGVKVKRSGRQTSPKAKQGRRGPCVNVSAVRGEDCQSSVFNEPAPACRCGTGTGTGTGTDLASVRVAKAQVVVHAQQQRKGHSKFATADVVS